MGVWLGFAVSADIPMNIEVGDHPAIDKLATYKVTGKLDSLLLVQLARDGKLDFAGKLGILAQLGGFNVIPQPFAVAPLLGRILGQHHLGMDNPGLIGEVEIGRASCRERVCMSVLI